MKYVITLLICFFILVACSVSMQDSKVDPNQPKPETITECDLFGWGSADIIAKKEKEGYEFIGATRGFWCENDLHFRLKVAE